MERRQVTVLTYDGYKGGERPRSFVLAGRTVDVVEIVMLRIEEDGIDRCRKRYFHVTGSDGNGYTLMEDERTLGWYVLS